MQFVTNLLGRWWRSGWKGKTALGCGAFVLGCCLLSVVVAIVNPRPRTSSTATNIAAVAATAIPTEAATAVPTEVPATEVPTEVPATEVPTAIPATAAPTEVPPTAVPTVVPTAEPTPRPAGYMHRDDLGSKWPLTVDEIELRCINGRELVFLANGTTYALNGTAKGTKQYADLAPIWLDDPVFTGLKISLQPLLDKGLPLCR